MYIYTYVYICIYILCVYIYKTCGYAQANQLGGRKQEAPVEAHPSSPWEIHDQWRLEFE